MSSASLLEASADDVAFTAEVNKENLKPLKGNSLVASARRLTSKKLKSRGDKKGKASKSEGWQEDAWDMYDLVGEERFLATTLANRMSQARFFVGKLPSDPTEDIEPITEGPVYDVFQSIAGKGRTFASVVQRAGVNLFIAGGGYLIGCPRKGAPKPEEPDYLSPVVEEVEEEEDPIGNLDVSTLEWKFYSVSEVEIDSSAGTVSFPGHKETNADDIVLIRVWRPHPRKWEDSDSPTRSSLPVLRELVGLTMHISAQVDSRLAGAGLFLIPASADQALRAAAGLTDEDASPFGEALMDAMLEPISDRSSASAVVPLMPVVPDESIEKFRLISFSSELDKEARALREEAIRRLALGQDCPPELLLGVGGMNHWGAWLVREDVVTTHLEPPLAILCDAITTEFFWPVLEDNGIADAEEYVFWYDVDHLIMRPNRSQDAAAGYEAGVIGDAAYRDALGFDESDAPEVDPTDPVVKLVIDMVRAAPSLAQMPGLSILHQQIDALMNGTEVPPSPETAGSPESTPAAPSEEPAPEGPPSEEGTPQ